jgi:hypothetical protein
MSGRTRIVLDVVGVACIVVTASAIGVIVAYRNAARQETEPPDVGSARSASLPDINLDAIAARLVGRYTVDGKPALEFDRDGNTYTFDDDGKRNLVSRWKLIDSETIRSENDKGTKDAHFSFAGSDLVLTDVPTGITLRMERIK